MPEINRQQINLVVIDPPYNVGTKFGNKIDLNNTNTYESMLYDVVSDIHRIIRDDGTIVVQAPHLTHNYLGDYNYSWNIHMMFYKFGFHLTEKHELIVIEEEASCIKIRDWTKTKSQISSFHSREHNVLVFTKKPRRNFQSDFLGTFIYVPSNGHPCPSNHEYLKIILDKYFKPGMNVLDPFMGTARLGEKVLLGGGHFYGYEIEKTYYEIAKKRLKDASRQ
jgi:hypothetical protein